MQPGQNRVNPDRLKAKQAAQSKPKPVTETPAPVERQLLPMNELGNYEPGHKVFHISVWKVEGESMIPFDSKITTYDGGRIEEYEAAGVTERDAVENAIKFAFHDDTEPPTISDL